MVDGPHRGLRAARESEFGEDARNVGARRSFDDAKPAGDLPVGDTSRDQDGDAAGGLAATAYRSRKLSRPTVRPGREPISRTARKTPGIKEKRSSESCRIVSVSP